ncbi:MAG: methyltransferase [Cytophagales bacterium]|nr:MAG: methyltransferase [Cytophagales bacterium]TAF61876.1 MAG: methyltransferase [Cytophagales bacterium]
MEKPLKRRAFEGTWNVVRFNWHFYVLFSLLSTFIWFFLCSPWAALLPAKGQVLLGCAWGLGFLSMLLSLAVSWYVYDYSPLYTFNWLKIKTLPNGLLLNIHAGFDETSFLLQKQFPLAQVQALDFYDPQLHTELSIKRARKVYPPYPNTLSIKTQSIDWPSQSTAHIFLILSAHEMRKSDERVVFFTELSRLLTEEGEMVVVEHLRDVPNFLAYNLGFFHFHSSKTWLETFKNARLQLSNSYRITPFLQVYHLKKHGATP